MKEALIAATVLGWVAPCSATAAFDLASPRGDLILADQHSALSVWQANRIALN